MAIKLDEVGVKECIGIVNTAIGELDAAAKSIDSAMNDLSLYWEGAAYEKTISTYDAEYKTLLTTTLPDAVESLRAYIEQCNVTISEVDAQLAGN